MLSSMIQVTTIGVVWSLLWQQPFAEMLPYVVVGLMTWLFFSTFITEAAGGLPQYTHFFLNQYLAVSTVVLAILYRNTVTFLINMILPLVLCIIYVKTFSIIGLLASVLGCALLITFCFISGLGLAIVCTRFRDLIQVVTSSLQILMYATPVLWRSESMPERFRVYLELNPVAIFVSLIRQPLIGEPLAAWAWLAAILYIIAACALTLTLAGRYSRRIVFWL